MYKSLDRLLESGQPDNTDPYLSEISTYHKMGLHNLSNLNEAYFGGNDLFKKAEAHLQNIKDILDKYSSTHQINRADYRSVELEMIELEEIFAEVFGLNKMLITAGRQNYANAFTFSVNGSWLGFSPKKLTVYNGKYGIQFNPKHKVNCNMTVTLPLMKICSPKEIMAIMIHEMGHNLNRNRSISDKLIMFPSQLLAGWISALLNSDKSIDAAKQAREDEMDTTKNVYGNNKIVNMIAKIAAKNKADDGKGSGGIAAIIMRLVWKSIMNNVIYKEENYSDSLAAAYGYGQEIATGLRKLYPGYASLEKWSPFGAAAYSVLMTLDPHPERIARAKYVRDYLEYELNNNQKIDKKEKAKLKADIESLDKLIAIDFTDDKGQDMVSFRQQMQKSFGVTDVRELYLKAKHDKVDKKTNSFEHLTESAAGIPEEVLLEVYYGTNPYLNKVEAEFKKMIDFCNKKKFTMDNIKSKIKKDELKVLMKHLDTIEEHFKELFGLREMSIIPMFDGLGAVATLSVQSTLAIYGKKLKVYQGEHAIKFNPKAGVNILMFLGLENILLMNEKELTSVFIHEFGHNLNRNQTLPSKFWMRVPTMMKFISSLFLSDSFVDSIKEDRNNMSEETYKSMTDKVSGLKERKSFKELVKVLADKHILGATSRFFLKNNEYREEKISDAFAAMFGYGQHVHTALRKFDEYFTRKYGGGNRNTSYNRFQAISEMFKQMSDPHPERVARIRSSINYIENELKKDSVMLPKEAREILENDLKVLKLIENEDIQKGGVGNVALRQAIMKVTGGAVDIREILIKDKYAKIDKKMGKYETLTESAVADAWYDAAEDYSGRAMLSESAIKEIVQLVEESYQNYDV